MEKQIKILGKMKRPKQPSRPSSAQPGRVPAPPDRWAPPVSGGSLPRTLSLSLSLSAQWGRAVGASCLHPRAPLPLCLAGPSRQCAEPLPPRARSLSLCRGTALSAPPSPRPPWTNTRARMPRSPAMSPTHAPHLLFEHRPHPHSLPRPISHSLALSCDLPTPFDLTRDPHLPRQSSSRLVFPSPC
jgi:hypothetical protein